MKVAVIGDVHGHLTEMLAAIEHAELAGVDRIVMLGDLLDRGPQSIACLRAAQSWTFRTRAGRQRKLEIIKGNYEDAYVRIADGIPKPGRDYVGQPEDQPLYRRLLTADIDWMRQLPYYIRVKELNLTCLHGGVTPHDFDLDDAGAWVLRTRYLDIDTALPLRSVATSDWFWADSYNGRFGTIVFGHEGHARPTVYHCDLGHVSPGTPSAIAIDGEGFGRLHGVIISEHETTAFTVRYRTKTVKMVRLATTPRRVHDWTGTTRQTKLWPEVG